MKKKLVGILFCLSMIICAHISLFLMGDFEVNAASNNTEDAFEAIEISETTISLEQLRNGISILITKNSEGDYSQEVVEDLSQIAVPAATADGVLEWAVFHVGLKDWTSTSNCLYYTLSADEYVRSIDGIVYVKPTNLLTNKYYYRNYLPSEVYSNNTSRVIKNNIDVENATRVVVGFENVTIKAISGDSGSFKNAKVTVTR